MEDYTNRPTNPDLDALLGTRFDVLNDGFVRVVDYMGSDEAIVQAARVSYGKGTKKVSEDRGLIRYLMRHRHTCLLYTSPSPRDLSTSRMPSSA